SGRASPPDPAHPAAPPFALPPVPGDPADPAAPPFALPPVPGDPAAPATPPPEPPLAPPPPPTEVEVPPPAPAFAPPPMSSDEHAVDPKARIEVQMVRYERRIISTPLLAALDMIASVATIEESAKEAFPWTQRFKRF